MAKYIVKRMLIAILTFLGITVLVYVLASLAPGSPVEMILGSTSNLTESDVERLEAQLGLDQPVYVQYLIWLKNVLSGNLGTRLTIYFAINSRLLLSYYFYTYILSFII